MFSVHVLCTVYNVQCSVQYFSVHRYVYEGYLYSSTVDYTATSPTDRLYTWSLLALGYILPNILILLSHLSILGLYRYNKFDAWEAGGSVEAGTHATNKRLQAG